MHAGASGAGVREAAGPLLQALCCGPLLQGLYRARAALPGCLGRRGVIVRFGSGLPGYKGAPRARLQEAAHAGRRPSVRRRLPRAAGGQGVRHRGEGGGARLGAWAASGSQCETGKDVAGQRTWRPQQIPRRSVVQRGGANTGLARGGRCVWGQPVARKARTCVFGIKKAKRERRGPSGGAGGSVCTSLCTSRRGAVVAHGRFGFSKSCHTPPHPEPYPSTRNAARGRAQRARARPHQGWGRARGCVRGPRPIREEGRARGAALRSRPNGRAARAVRGGGNGWAQSQRSTGMTSGIWLALKRTLRRDWSREPLTSTTSGCSRAVGSMLAARLGMVDHVLGVVTSACNRGEESARAGLSGASRMQRASKLVGGAGMASVGAP
ncbi:MAG: hypothetical protein J3K34DRAFT_444997 [Monoraphidium minutum]|nr:MAG: hypothetical protein J3K34DRAFT_444997 [Monoraphidium minutum]